jgi:DNA repair exonuclease SbcCD ATPase subunit
MVDLEQINRDMSEIQSFVSEKGTQVRKWLTINEAIEERSSSILANIESTKKEYSSWETAKKLYGLIMAEARATEKADIVKCVGGIVKHFYGDEYEFDVEFADDGSLDFVVRENVEGKIKTYYVTGDDSVGLGGGLSDTISSALRIMLILKSGSIGPLAMDEAYRQLDSERANKVGAFLSSICDEHGLQILMCTHLLQVAEESDMKIQVQKIGGKSIATCEEQ